MLTILRLTLGAAVLVLALPVSANVLTFGDKDCLGTGCYGASDPAAGATQQGLVAGVVTLASLGFGHGFPFTPGAGEFPGTDQIFVGSFFAGTAHDGYAGSSPTLGPNTMTLNYGSLVTGTISTLTLGIAADDFQDQALGQPFIAKINGVTNGALTNELNSFNQSGPVVQFLTIGIAPAALLGSNILTLSIDDGGDGGDGFAVDF